MQRNKNGTIEIDLVLLTKELLTHWIAILLSTVLVGGIFFSTSKFLITPQYNSTANLYVLNKETSLTSLADMQIGSNLLQDYKSIAQSRIVLTSVIDELELEESYEALKGKLTVSNPSDRIMSLTIRDASPERAKVIVDTLSDVITEHVEDKMDQKALTVLEYGYADSKKVSPNTSKNALMGAMLGCLIACFAVFVSFILNDKVNSTDDIEKRLGINVLGLVPYENAQDDKGVSLDKKKKRKAAKRK